MDNLTVKEMSQTDRSLGTAMKPEQTIGAHILASEELEHGVHVNLLQSKEENVEQDINNETLHHQLEQIWKTDFGYSTVGPKFSPSIEDNIALSKMEQSLRRVDGHIQVALPWRQEFPELPNNKLMAERRLQHLKKRLLKDEDLLTKYQSTMQDYILKGHAKKVPSEELNQNVKERPVWYLPHHPVTHPLKPGKVRVVFDCAAKYHGTSLNQQLLQGPDLTNPLVGVLIRFRQEPIAMAADIEAMFHQVYVDPEDRDTLRFLWWPNGDLSKEPEEYRMVKHLFGATSSPSCANFSLKKTASINSGEFDHDTVKTVERNMYVDDLMKSVSSPETAISV